MNLSDHNKEFEKLFPPRITIGYQSTSNVYGMVRPDLMSLNDMFACEIHNSLWKGYMAGIEKAAGKMGKTVWALEPDEPPTWKIIRILKTWY